LRHFTVIRSLLALNAVVVVLFLSSCNAGEATIGSAEQALFSQAPGSPIAVAGGPGNVCIGDMNNDRKPDLVVASGETRSIIVLLGVGNGQFRASSAGALSLPDSPGDMVLGDLNGDGNLDSAFVTHDSYGVTILVGDARGGLALAPNSPIMMKEGQHPHTHGLGIGDLNGDGKLDLATVNHADNDVSIAFGDGRGGFTHAPGSPFAVGPSPYPLALGDINNDGHLDIVATASATGPARAQQLSLSRALTLLVADGRGQFRTTQTPLRTGEPWFVAIGDINGDHKADLVATHHERNELTVLLSNGKGQFTEVDGSPFNLGRNVFQLALAEVNHDGKTDVIAATGAGVLVLVGDGRGSFTQAQGSPYLTGKGAWHLAIGDLNTDGKIDVVTTNVDGNSVSVLLGR
jgi:hypothetical protein